MVLVRGSEPYTKVVFGIESTFGTAQTSGCLELPIISETLTINSQTLPESAEIRSTGALSDIEDGRNYIQGSITVRPKYNAKAFGQLMCLAFGGMEQRVADYSSTGSNLVSTIATHIYVTQAFSETAAGSESGTGQSLTIYVYKSGPDDTGKLERFRGAICTGFTWDQPAYDHPTCTFNFFAIAPGSTDMIDADSGPAATAPADTEIDVLGSDLQEDSGAPEIPGGLIFQNGVVLDNLTTFSFTLDGNYSIPDASLLDIDSMEKTGHDAPWSITFTGSGYLPKTYYGTAHPAYASDQADGLMNTSEAIRVIYCSPQYADVSETANYHCDLLIDSAYVADYTNNVTDSGLVAYNFELRGVLGSTTSTASGSGTNWAAPLIFQNCCNDTDDSGATWCTAAQGANDAPDMKNT